MNAVLGSKFMTRVHFSDNKQSLSHVLNELMLVSTLFEVTGIELSQDNTGSATLMHSLGVWKGDARLTAASLICYAESLDLDAKFLTKVHYSKRLIKFHQLKLHPAQ